MAKPSDDRSKSGASQPTPSKLGRGLGSLIPVSINKPKSDPGLSPQAAPAPRPTAVVSTTVEVKTEPLADSPVGAAVVEFLPIRSIQPGKYQPRGGIDPTSLEALARSIEQSGLMQPIVVRRVVGQSGRYELIAGERRWRAMDRLGRTEVPAIVQAVDDAKAAELSLVENLQREDLNPMDRASALRRLADEFGWTHQELADRVGLDRPSISNLLRLNELDAACAAHVRSAALSLGHAKVLLGVSDLSVRRSLAEQAVGQDWSVRQLEAAVRDGAVVPRGTTRGKGRTPGSAHLADLRRQLEEHLGTRVELKVGRKKGSGELRIQFFTLDEFDGLMQRIGFQGDRMTV